MDIEKQTNIPLSTEQAEIILSRWLGMDVKCTGIERLYGGMINSVLKLYFDKEPFDAVIKLKQADDGGFAGEAQDLEYLRANTKFPCPQVYCEDNSGQHASLSFLLIETLPGVTIGHARLSASDRAVIDKEMAEILLELHSHKRDTFGSPHKQLGKKKWTEIFVPRMMDMREEMTKKISREILQNIDHAVKVAEEIMSAQGEPTLIHGDIWSGNIMVAQDENGWHLSGIVDPGTQYADVEMELAYLQVFSTVGDDFFQAYTLHSPLRSGYELRRLFYWLNTYMIHVWIFGDAHYHEMTAKISSAIVKHTS